MTVEEAAIRAVQKLGVHAGTRIPAEPKPDAFIRIIRSGGNQRDKVTISPILTFDIFHTEEGSAEAIAEDVVQLLNQASVDQDFGGMICYVSQILSLPVNLPMPSVPTHYRYTVSVSLDLRI